MVSTSRVTSTLLPSSVSFTSIIASSNRLISSRGSSLLVLSKTMSLLFSLATPSILSALLLKKFSGGSISDSSALTTPVIASTIMPNVIFPVEITIIVFPSPSVPHALSRFLILMIGIILPLRFVYSFYIWGKCGERQSRKA